MSKLTTDVVTYCTEASNEKSKYAYRKIFLYKKALGIGSGWVQICPLVVGWAVLGRSADGLGRIGSREVDPARTTVRCSLTGRWTCSDAAVSATSARRQHRRHSEPRRLRRHPLRRDVIRCAVTSSTAADSRDVSAWVSATIITSNRIASYRLDGFP